MEIKIKGTPKEIAELALKLQTRQKTKQKNTFDNHLAGNSVNCAIDEKGIHVRQQEKVDFATVQKAITEIAKKIRDEKFLIVRIKEILLEHENFFKERFCDLLQEHNFSIPENRDFFYKRNAETIINAVSKSIIREIWKI